MATLFPVSLVAPGRWGINLQEQNWVLHPNWATSTDGLVLDDSSQLRGRGSLTAITTAPASDELLRLHNYITAAGTETVISTTATKILQSLGNLTSVGNDITPTGTPTNGFWKFINFNGKVLGWQASHTPIVWSGSGDFATITVSDGGTLPDGDVAHAAFGRVWAVDDDKQTVRYSGLLDETRWATASGAGSIDMRNVWSQGMDYVTAISSIGSNLVIFGRKHIVFYTDGSGSTVGVDPAQMYAVDIIEGTGCVARDSVVQVGEGDLLFLSELGVQSLGRVLQSKDNRLITISWQIADRLAGAVSTELNAQASSSTDVRGFVGLYTPSTGQYFLVHNNGTVEDVYVFHPDDRQADEKGRELVPITLWDTAVLTNMRGAIQLRGGNIYFTGGLANHINLYNPDSSLDNGTAGIYADYQSGWIDWANPEIESLTKLLKFVQVTVANPSDDEAVLTFKHGTDFANALDELDAAAEDADPIRNIYDVTGDIEGQYFKIGVESARFGRKLLQHILMHFKLGRIYFSHNKDGQGDPSDDDLGGGSSAPSANLQLFVVLSSDGTGDSNRLRCATSMDGVTWTARSMASVAAWTDLCYSPELNLIVAIATNTINTSPDGITWTDRTSPGNGGWRAVCWSPRLALFVAVGTLASTQRVMTSPDGITWTLRTTPAAADNTWTSVLWHDALRIFIAGSSGTITDAIMTSPDGITWTSRTTPTTGVDELVFSASMVLGVNRDVGTADGIYSLDGVVWAATESIPGGGATCLAYGDGVFVVSTSSGAAGLYSAGNPIAAASWVTGTGIDTNYWEEAIYSVELERFIAINNVGTSSISVYSSVNGSAWSSLGTLPAVASGWLAIIETEQV